MLCIHDRNQYIFISSPVFSVMQNEITHIHTKREKKREMPHFINSIFHEFFILPVLSFLDIQDTPGLPLLSAMLSHLCLTVPYTCCPSSHNLTPSLEPFVLFLPYPVFFCTGNTSILSGSELLHCCWRSFLSWEEGLCSFLRAGPGQLL